VSERVVSSLRKLCLRLKVHDMTIRTFASLAAALTMTALAASPAPAQSTGQVGTLSCDVSAGVGMILTQKRTLTCVFTPTNGGPPEPYLGRIDEFGIALGAVNQAVWCGA
jgi:hypothetical protein